MAVVRILGELSDNAKSMVQFIVHFKFFIFLHGWGIVADTISPLSVSFTPIAKGVIEGEFTGFP